MVARDAPLLARLREAGRFLYWDAHASARAADVEVCEPDLRAALANRTCLRRVAAALAARADVTCGLRTPAPAASARQAAIDAVVASLAAGPRPGNHRPPGGY